MDIVFNALEKIPDMTDNEAHEVASKFNRLDEITNKADKRDTATKVDIEKIEKIVAKQEAKLIAEMYRLNNRTIMWIVGVGFAVIGVIKYL